MKSLKLFSLALALISLSACSASNKAGYYYNGESYMKTPDAGDYSYKAEDASGDMSHAGAQSSKPTIRPGQLTCSAVNDNEKYDYWLDLLGLKNQNRNDFTRYNDMYGSYFRTYPRVKLTVKNGNDISIKVKGEDNKFYVDNTETAYIFPKELKESYEVDISYLDKNNERVTYSASIKNNDVIDLENEFTLSDKIEIMFVVDATGSMGDEMNYIKSEIIDVIGQVKDKNPESTVNLAMMVYRDVNDLYVTKYNDFTTDIEAQQTWFASQTASGGGDTPEAVETALKEAVEKQWSEGSTKIIVHVADAPSHERDIEEWSKQAFKAADQGIKIITVSGSGINKQTEFLFRSQSLITAGQYVFLTDDSGIGGSHIEASTDQDPLVVEYLNDCLVRLINGYATGDFRKPVHWTQA